MGVSLQTAAKVLDAYVSELCAGLPGDSWPPVALVEGKLKEAGWTFVASGCYGMVLKSPHPEHEHLVFKLGMRRDDAAFAYAQWARANPGEHIVEILHVQKIGNGYIYVMPKYEEVDCGASYEQRREWEHILQGFDLHRERYPSIAALADYFDGCVCVDMHAGNVMYDPERGQLIITDPFAADYTTPHEECV